MRLVESDMGVRIASAALVLGLGAGALGACSTEGSQPVNHDAFPQGSVATDPSTTTTALPGEVTIPEIAVVSGPLSSLKDHAMDVVPTMYIDAYSDFDIPVKASEARSAIAAIDNQKVVDEASLFLDAQLSHATRFPSFLTSSDQYVSNNQELLQRHEAAVDLINDPEIKSAAEKSLDYQEAKAAVSAGSGYREQPQNVQLFLDSVEDADIKSQAQQIIAGDEIAKKALDQQAIDAGKTVETQWSAAYTGLYTGSNRQAETINKDIADFNQAQIED